MERKKEDEERTEKKGNKKARYTEAELTITKGTLTSEKSQDTNREYENPDTPSRREKTQKNNIKKTKHSEYVN